MQNSEQTVLRDIVLVGGGHSHVGVLRRFAMNPEPGVRITVICTDVDTPYSGMLPGYIAGHYSFDEVHIDLGRLCAFAGARLYVDAVIGIDHATQTVLCRNRPPVAYDVLSINIGSAPQVSLVAHPAHHAHPAHPVHTNGVDNIVPVKPIAQFNQRWLALLDKALHWPSDQGSLNVAVVGGGAGGVELVLAMQFRIAQELTALGRDANRVRFSLLTAGAHILPTHNARVRQRFTQVLAQRGIALHTNAEVVNLIDGTLHTQDGRSFATHETLWVTQAAGAPWLKGTGLALDAHGFIQVNAHLQSVNDLLVFAAGDTASFVNRPLEKAGVFAVRMGTPLEKNLRRTVRGQRLIRYTPQRRWLALISTGDQYAVASRGALNFAGAWVWRWKDRIDRKFMHMFTQFPSMNMAAGQAGQGVGLINVVKSMFKPTASPTHVALTSEESLQAISAIAMRCGGCGAKVGASILSRALGSLKPVDRDDVLIGLHSPDDAAVVRVPAGKAMVHTVDFFRAFIDDPYVFGKVAANHALGDIFAMGAQAQSATAVVTVPPGLERKVEDLLTQMMGGAIEVLNTAGCALVGGHTGEGKELALGFAINGLIDMDANHKLGSNHSKLMQKGGMRAGDVLLLTKPFGTGTLFAAHMRYAAKGRWIAAALQFMQQSNQAGAAVLQAHGSTACTDLTGFGLLGHLVEMTRPSGVDAQLSLSALPLLDGAVECVQAGIVSSLQPANVRLRRALRNAQDFVSDPRYPLLFDPQTAGGLLASVPAAQADACVAALKAAGYTHTAIIGQILPQSDVLEPVVLVA